MKAPSPFGMSVFYIELPLPSPLLRGEGIPINYRI